MGRGCPPQRKIFSISAMKWCILVVICSLMPYSLAEVQGQQTVSMKIEWKQTDGDTDGGDCITSFANVVHN